VGGGGFWGGATTKTHTLYPPRLSGYMQNHICKISDFEF
jgi:hypothetical protein